MFKTDVKVRDFSLFLIMIFMFCVWSSDSSGFWFNYIFLNLTAHLQMILAQSFDLMLSVTRFFPSKGQHFCRLVPMSFLFLFSEGENLTFTSQPGVGLILFTTGDYFNSISAEAVQTELTGC